MKTVRDNEWSSYPKFRIFYLNPDLVRLIPYLCVEMITPTSDDSTSIDAFLACRLIPLNKNPGLHPIGSRGSSQTYCRERQLRKIM